MKFKSVFLTSLVLSNLVDTAKGFSFNKLDLQTHNEGGDVGGEVGGADLGGEVGGNEDLNGQQGGADEDVPGGQKDNGSKTNTFTQKDVNAIAAREAKSAREAVLKQLGYENLDAAKKAAEDYAAILESQKTDAQRRDEAHKNLQKENKGLQSQISDLNAQIAAFKVGVKPDSLQDAIVLAKPMVAEDVTIEDALRLVVEKYPNFGAEASQQQQSKPKFSTGEHKKDAEVTPEDQFMAAFANLAPSFKR